MYSTQYGFLFIHVPKTGGNAIQQLLLPFADDKLTTLKPYQDGVHRFGLSNAFKLPKHATLADYQAAFGGQRIRDFIKFSCIRNPWDRAVSYYFSPHRGEVEWDRNGFINLLDEIQPLTHFIKLDPTSGCRLTDDIDFLIRFECLEADLKTVAGVLGIQPGGLKKLNSSQRRNYRYYYDAELIQMVEARFREEIEVGGYSFK